MNDRYADNYNEFISKTKQNNRIENRNNNYKACGRIRMQRSFCGSRLTVSKVDNE